MGKFSELLRERGGAIAIGIGLLLILVMLPWLLIITPPPTNPNVTSTATPTRPTPGPRPPTPSPTLPSLRLRPQHGIHAPIGGQWTGPQRQALAEFRDSTGQPGAPGLVLALSTDLQAANNPAQRRMEEDLRQYERQGAEIYVRMYPQRFPGGYTEPLQPGDGRNTISGSPEDVAADIFRLVDAQQRRNGWHFSRIVPGNEPDLEWPNELHAQNLLPWRSSGDPAKYQVMNRFWAEVYRAWQTRLAQPDAAAYQDVRLYFPPLAQDASPGPDYYAGFYFYGYDKAGQLKPVGNRYEALRPAIELYGRFSWHNYFQPGRACQDVTALAFPDWLRHGLEIGWEAVIGEAGWSPEKLVLPASQDSRARLTRFWQRLGVRWEPKLYQDDRPQWRSTDETIDGARFEDDLRQFTGGCHLRNLQRSQPIGVAVWLAGSEGNFAPALGVEPGQTGLIRRWLRLYAALTL